MKWSIAALLCSYVSSSKTTIFCCFFVLKASEKSTQMLPKTKIGRIWIQHWGMGICNCYIRWSEYAGSFLPRFETETIHPNLFYHTDWQSSKDEASWRHATPTSCRILPNSHSIYRHSQSCSERAPRFGRCTANKVSTAEQFTRINRILVYWCVHCI